MEFKLHTEILGFTRDDDVDGDVLQPTQQWTLTERSRTFISSFVFPAQQIKHLSQSSIDHSREFPLGICLPMLKIGSACLIGRVEYI